MVSPTQLRLSATECQARGPGNPASYCDTDPDPEVTTYVPQSFITPTVSDQGTAIHLLWRLASSPLPARGRQGA